MNKRKWTLSVAAAMLAVAMFWATMLTSPPQSEAALQEGINIDQLSLAAAPGMATFEDTHQRHIGVLDALKR